jgi:hypothetical protein
MVLKALDTETAIDVLSPGCLPRIYVMLCLALFFGDPIIATAILNRR